jgi:hypothetical protein
MNTLFRLARGGLDRYRIRREEERAMRPIGGIFTLA